MSKRIILLASIIASATAALFAATVSASAVGPVPGWPSASGSASGNYMCSPVTLTSTSDPFTYGAIDFDGPFGTFATLPIFSTSDFTPKSGVWGTDPGGQSEPYIIVRFSDDTEAFVYATDVEPNTPGDQRYSDDVNQNTYLTRDQALASYGTKQVSSVTLAVDNGNLSIEVNGVLLDNCVGGALPPPPNHMFLAYSHFEQDGGKLFTNAEALALLQETANGNFAPTDGYWAPYAILGNTDPALNPQISGYHLVANCSAPMAPTGQYLHANNDGTAEITNMKALVSGSAAYPICK